ncbi:tetratricopeptide repeat protein [Photobacterium leiognathi]|uniref:tetratricopeptide repeat protein n=1 Tax=Photobacterium leiognathi TaxID=553611 RepID=UPI0029825381|nr:tetratricopeptide repeat protein [Photobacterium leiognathi]
MTRRFTPIIAATFLTMSVGAIAQDDLSSQQLYEKGFNAFQDRNYQPSLELTQKAALAGSADALFLLSDFYLAGIPNTLSPDHTKGIHYLKQAAQAGNVDAMHNLSAFYLQGLYGLPVDEHQSLKWLLRSASNGNAVDQNNLAMHYRKEGDTSQVIYWLKKSAAQNYAKGIQNLANCYYLGYGVKQNLNHAFDLTEQAATLGDLSSVFTLGTMYVYGYGVDADVERGYAMIANAAKHGNAKAKQFLKDNPIRLATLNY